ncbi:hypothetical protein E2C01_056116 [Portunus trituberculatus]|uniref:Uncharacterized protein n=1 Tax=Portunus trituberculatus TaxID=210409 RepID=A0A5B7GWQ4_PORTR|nr:hypothetical protein [Portunus trituberculatus]
MFLSTPCICLRWHVCNYDFHFFNSSVLIVTPITSTIPSPYYHEPLLALLPLFLSVSCPAIMSLLFKVNMELHF